MLCDHGADLTVTNQSGQTPMIFSAKNKHDDVCMYLSLRTTNIDEEDEDVMMMVDPNVKQLNLFKKIKIAISILIRGGK